MKEIEKIKTKKDFVSFVKSLSQDYYANPKSWRNNNIGEFLEALAGWAEDLEGYYINHGQTLPEKTDWKMIADMLIAAKIYE